MTLESWALFTKVSEEVVIQLLPQIPVGAGRVCFNTDVC